MYPQLSMLRICRHGSLMWYSGLRCIHQKVRVRFAPSPTGQLHLGGLRTALYNYLFARSHGGKFVLRIEDTDQTRLVQGAQEALENMLKWSGIHVDEGPAKEGPYGPYKQSERLEIYWEHIQILLENRTAYPCFCTPKRMELLKKEANRRGEVPKYDNRCRNIDSDVALSRMKDGEPCTVRFKLERFLEPWCDIVYGPISNDVSSIEGDPILMKTDRYPTYHFANVVDDHLMKISHVLRGVEWQVSTTKHILLYRAFGWDPPAFAHLPLILNSDGSKLSKRQNDIHVEHMKNQGVFPEAVNNILTSMGSGFKVRDTVGLDMRHLIENFDLKLMKTNSTKLDLKRIPEINRKHLQCKLKDKESREWLIDEVRHRLFHHFAEDSKMRELHAEVFGDENIGHILDWTQDRISYLEDLFSKDYMFLWSLPHDTDVLKSVSDINDDMKVKLLRQTLDIIKVMEEENGLLKKDEMQKCLRKISNDNDVKFSAYMKLLRASLSGLKEGPSVADMLFILGKHASIERLFMILDNLEKELRISRRK